MNGGKPTPPGGGAQKVAAVRPRSGRAAPAGAPGAVPGGRLLAHVQAERRLMARVFGSCHGAILAATRSSSVPGEFLGALTANESGGRPQATRFEPAVYRHLKAVAGGQETRYGGIRREDLVEELGDKLHPKSDEFHTRHLAPPFAAENGAELAATSDESLRELATSWGYTQVMGYHVLGRSGTVRDLLEPNLHFRLAVRLLAEFAERYQLDLAREFEEMFRCWNAGQPYGATFDPGYAARGLARMEIYRQIAALNQAAAPMNRAAPPNP